MQKVLVLGAGLVGKAMAIDLSEKFDVSSADFSENALAQLVVDGKFNWKGICPPEYLGEDESHFKFIQQYLKDRNVNYQVNVK